MDLEEEAAVATGVGAVVEADMEAAVAGVGDGAAADPVGASEEAEEDMEAVVAAKVRNKVRHTSLLMFKSTVVSQENFYRRKMGIL